MPRVFQDLQIVAVPPTLACAIIPKRSYILSFIQDQLEPRPGEGRKLTFPLTIGFYNCLVHRLLFKLW